MFKWLLSKLRRTSLDDDPKALFAVADQIAPLLLEPLLIQFRTADCEPSEIPHLKEFFVAAYIAGYCSVAAQAMNARAGGSVSMTLSMRLMMTIFGDTHGEYMWREVEKAMQRGDQTNSLAMACGGHDANSFFQKKDPSDLLAAYLVGGTAPVKLALENAGVPYKNAPTAYADALVNAVYPPDALKTANVLEAIELANNELLLGRFDKKEITDLATALAHGPIPYSTHDLAASVALGLLRKIPKDARRDLMEVQMMARLKVGSWATEGKVVKPLAEAFEQTLYRGYHPDRL